MPCWNLRLLLLASALALPASAAGLGWTNNLLVLHDSRLPGGTLEVFFLEAFCLPGGHARPWGQTRIPHQTTLLNATPDASELRFRTTIGPDVEVLHEARIGTGDVAVEMTFLLSNRGTNAWPVQWFQPACVRVDRFTARGQSNYTASSFVFTGAGRTPLDRLRRTTNALYLGGQVFLPPWTREEDANPRPIARDRVTNGVIGCVSGDGRWILALASDRTFELFEGVYVCLHSDPLIGGLAPGETRRIRQLLYLLPNDPERLLKRYREDLQPTPDKW